MRLSLVMDFTMEVLEGPDDDSIAQMKVMQKVRMVTVIKHLVIELVFLMIPEDLEVVVDLKSLMSQ